MSNNLLEQARLSGFIYQVNNQGYGQITPSQSGQPWKLQQIEDQRWLLIINEIPQISFIPSEAVAFLQRRRTYSSFTKSPKTLPQFARTY